MKSWQNLLPVIGFCLASLGACSPQPEPPQRCFAIEQLFVDAAAFPPGWIIDPEGPFTPAQAPFGGVRSLERPTLMFYAETGGLATEQIQRYRTASMASEEFERWLISDFREEEFGVPWFVPREVSYDHLVPDRFHLACNTAEARIPMCRFLGQYEEYVIRFNTHMSPESMTYGDFERVLQAIDERMAQYLSNAD